MKLKWGETVCVRSRCWECVCLIDDRNPMNNRIVHRNQVGIAYLSILSWSITIWRHFKSHWVIVSNATRPAIASCSQASRIICQSIATRNQSNAHAVWKLNANEIACSGSERSSKICLFIIRKSAHLRCALHAVDVCLTSGDSLTRPLQSTELSSASVIPFCKIASSTCRIFSSSWLRDARNNVVTRGNLSLFILWNLGGACTKRLLSLPLSLLALQNKKNHMQLNTNLTEWFQHCKTADRITIINKWLFIERTAICDENCVSLRIRRTFNQTYD